MKTVIKYMTDGMLLREILVDDSSCLTNQPHEHAIHTDLCLGFPRSFVRIGDPI